MSTDYTDRRPVPLSTVDSGQDYEELSGSCVNLSDIVVINSAGVDDQDFDGVAAEVVMALESGIHAELISAGSSGSYFVRDRQKVTAILPIAVNK